MESFNMMKTNTPCRSRDLCSRRWVKFFSEKIHRSTENLSMMMIHGFPLMTLGEDHQRGILLIDVIQHDPDRKQIRVGVGIKGPILMPINSSAAFCGLDVQFAVSKTDILTNQDSQDFQ